MKLQLKKNTIVVLAIGATLVGGRAFAASPLAATFASLLPTASAITLPTLPTSISDFLAVFNTLLGNKASTITKDGYLNPNHAIQQKALTTGVADSIAAQLGLNAANAKIIEDRLADAAVALSNSDAADNSLDATKQGNKMLQHVIKQQAQNTQTTQGLADLAVANQYALNEIKNVARDQQIDAQAMSLSAKPFLLFSGN